MADDTTILLSESQPHQDLFQLVTKKDKFVDSFLKIEKFNGWIVGKAIVGALLLRMVGALLSSHDSDQMMNMAEEWMGNNPGVFGGAFNFSVVKQMQAQAAALGMLMSPMAYTFEILWKVLGSVVFLYFLKPEGSPKTSWIQLIVLYSYLSWLCVFGWIPYVGWLIEMILMFFWTIYAFERIYNLSNFKAFLAAYGTGFVGLLLAFGVALGLVIAL